jgi:thioesterase domain-containing protein
LVTPVFLQAVPEGHPTYSIQARGLIDGKSPHRSVPAMANEYLDSIETVGNSSRPILVGVCVGGVIAVEMARQARQRGLGTLPVIMLDPPFPPYRRGRMLKTQAILGYGLALAVPFKRLSRAIAWRAARSVRDRAAMNSIWQVAAIDTDAAMRVWLSLALALRRHRPKPYDGPINMIVSDVRTSRGIADAWHRELTGTVRILDTGGGHEEALDPGNARFRAAMAQSVAASATDSAAAPALETMTTDTPAVQEGTAG